MLLYYEGELILKKNKHSVSLRSQIFNDKKLKSSPKHIYALVYSTLKYMPYIQRIIAKSKIEESAVIKKQRISREMLMLLVYDLLFSARGRIQLGKHRVKDAFLLHRARLQAEFAKLKLKYKVRSVGELPCSSFDEDETPVRWFRINTLRTTRDRFFKEHSYFAGLEFSQTLPLKQGQIYEDIHVPNLFGVNPKEKLTTTKAYVDGELIIQDRASCFPAHILFEAEDEFEEIIDACSAPGNKTTHAAAYLVGNSKQSDSLKAIYAFERDSNRHTVLKKMCEKATGSEFKNSIKTFNADFTAVDPNDYPKVTGIMVDPSCSGSGIFGRSVDAAFQEDLSNQIDEARLSKLAGFQVSIMKHALSFPNVKKVVYSTCSIHPQENERVVVDLLTDPNVKSRGWKLASREDMLPHWQRRGWEEEFSSLSRGDIEIARKYANGCVRAVPKEDGGIGFFAACFVRNEDSQCNESHNDQTYRKDSIENEEEWVGFEDQPNV